MAAVIACTRKGFTHVQLNDILKLQKSWVLEEKEYRVDAYFGTLCNGPSTPVVVMNVYEQNAGAPEVIDDNCDVWKNIFTRTNKEDGNNFYSYLKKHGFKRVKM